MPKRFTKVSLVLAAAFVSLFLAEGLLRLLLPQQLVLLDGRQIWQPDEDLGWRMKPNIDTFVDTGEGRVRVVTDTQGRRAGTRSPPAQEQPTSIRVLAVGDSFVEALGVDYESTLPRRLELDWTRLTGEPVAVSARAASGWNPYQYYLAVKKELRDHRYDLGVVFLYAANDIIDGTPAITKAQIGRRRQFRAPRAWASAEWRGALLYPLNDLLERRSHLFVFLRTKGNLALARFGLTSAYFPEVFRKLFATSPNWDSTVEICRGIRDEFIRHNTPVTFVLLPASYQVHKEMFESYINAFAIERGSVDLEQPNRILAGAFAKNSMTLLDPLELMRAGASRGVLLFGRIDRHLNAEGIRVVSRFVADAIAEASKPSDTNEIAAHTMMQRKRVP